MTLLGLAAGVALGAIPAPGSHEFDIQCFALLAVAVDTSDEEMGSALQLATMYYFGRVDARADLENLDSNVEAFADEVDAGNVDTDALAQACGDYMSQQGKALENLGDRLTARGY